MISRILPLDSDANQCQWTLNAIQWRTGVGIKLQNIVVVALARVALGP